ncbi:lactate utilization protein C [Pendulispora albinea]|uniref:LUD domain-containing protein n=1 Tax=Pendulispora albinea TaxID=2741071 RepID=A0ABZ2M6N1_9BACT
MSDRSRDHVLRSLRAATAGMTPVALPERSFTGVRFADVEAQFAKSVAEVGGRCIFAEDAALESTLLQLPAYAAAKRVLSRVPGLARANVERAELRAPRETWNIDFCVLPGELGVAENGAVWVVEAGFSHRAAWFLAEHMALVVPARKLVHNMHEAYERIELGSAGFATFVSGPSKTADIEQSLVIGAQGPRSCTVLVTRGPA